MATIKNKKKLLEETIKRTGYNITTEENAFYRGLYDETGASMQGMLGAASDMRVITDTTPNVLGVAVAAAESLQKEFIFEEAQFMNENVVYPVPAYPGSNIIELPQNVFNNLIKGFFKKMNQMSRVFTKEINGLKRELNEIKTKNVGLSKSLVQIKPDDDYKLLQKWFYDQEQKYSGEILAYIKIGGKPKLIAHSKDDDKLEEFIERLLEQGEISETDIIYFKQL